MATMKQVAQLAGVSNATVSHVVNGTKQLSAATTRRVRQAMKELGYRPKRDMGGARTRLKAIGVLVEDMRCLPVPDVLCGIAEALEPAGYQILLHDLHLYEKLYNQYELIGAYREEGNVAILRAKLKAEGYPSYTEKLGDKIRVRAGPFPNKAAADKAAARIQKVLGVSASVAAKS